MSYIPSCQIITEIDILHFKSTCMQFCEKFENLMGPEEVIPTIHLHNHLHSVLRDFGPFSSSWTFAFEHYNGSLSNLPTNKTGIEKQRMGRFIWENLIIDKKFDVNTKISDDKRVNLMRYLLDPLELLW